jgi:cell division protein FtsN
VRKNSVAKSKRPSGGNAISFNAPSFSVGLILGAVAVLLLPEVGTLFESSPIVKTEPIGEAPELIFNYDTLLSHSEVPADTEAYPVKFEDPKEIANASYLLQAASFRSLAEAAELKYQLVEQQLPAEVSRVMVEDQPWFRVTVGPFKRRIEVQRAVDRLRQNNLAPMELKRG